jgi:hypothetical protein
MNHSRISGDIRLSCYGREVSAISEKIVVVSS